MKKNIFLFCIVTVLFAACSNHDDELEINDQTDLSRSYVTYSGDVEGVSVLVFGFWNGDYYFRQQISTGWEGKKTKANLELGDYKFLFYKAGNTEIIHQPSSLTSSLRVQDISFKAKENTLRSGYVMPVEEIWLPKKRETADEIHSIRGNDLIQDTLSLAVSGVEVYLYRGKKEGEEYKPVTYDVGTNIMDLISEIRLDINGVGEVVNYAGTTGNKKTYYSTDTETSISSDGFAFFEGPLVLPSQQGVEEAEVDIELIPNPNSILKDFEMKTTVKGKLERSRKLSISLWLTYDTFNTIYVDVDTSEITSLNKGDEGIWE